jgi:hypothetical protein
MCGWPVVFVATLVLVRHLSFKRAIKSSQLSRPRDSIRKENISEGYLQSKDLQASRSFLNFLSSVSGLPKKLAENGACSGTEDHTVVRIRERPPKKLVIPNRAESPVRNLLLGFGRALLFRSQSLSRCGNHLEILWDAIIDRIKRRTYVCKVSRTVGFALVCFRLD